MPRENRKRGKKLVETVDEQPSWIISGPKEVEEIDPGAPYGYVDADIKAYFRTVDVQIRDWQENRDDDAGEAGDTDPNDRMFSLSILKLNTAF